MIYIFHIKYNTIILKSIDATKPLFTLIKSNTSIADRIKNPLRRMSEHIHVCIYIYI